ncbi:DUF4251 domain-containing protein [Flagellimonas pacifica]|uniref:DUF4251 domain-containing protein n=1 Tax=Flagellimonas pacifica TaxID=1247520 RepID=A0A285MWX2_9FLAO|nr:DUF4251 domain-containing protein [Allomuricauda parva]SNY99981.1 protein of unknown function [Allomuricauda parva]
MKTLSKITIIVLAIALLSCASHSKSSATVAEVDALQKLVAEKTFIIKANWAMPMATGSLNRIANTGLIPPGSTANRIDITGNGSYLRVLGDSVAADLPYFGERQMGGGYTNDTGIKFEGVPQELTFIPDDKSKGYTVNFNISKGTETYQVSAKLFPNRTSLINIISSQRTSIRYDGRVDKYTREE